MTGDTGDLEGIAADREAAQERNPEPGPEPAPQRLGEIGLGGFAPYLMNRIMARYNASLRHEMAKLGWSTPRMRVLAVLSVIEGPTARQLAAYTVLEQSTLSRALDALVAEGLVRREGDPADSRITRVFATREGRAAFEAFWPRVAQTAAQMFRGVPEAERLAFTVTLQKMLANIRMHDS